MADDLLTPSVRIETGVPFPQSKGNPPEQKDNLIDPDDTIVAEICSEFTEYRAQVEHFKKNGRIRLLHDNDSLPIVFTLSNDSSLCVLRHGVYDAEGWVSADVSPSVNPVTCFDVIQVGTTLYIAASCKTSKESLFHSLYYCTVDISSPEFDFEDEHKAIKEGHKGMGWTLIQDNVSENERVGELVISSLLCKVLINADNSLKAFQIVVATKEHGDRTATHYLVNAADATSNCWAAMTFPVAASLVVQTEPLVLGDISNPVREDGILSVCKDYGVGERLRCVGQIAAPSGGFNRSFEFKAGRLGSVQSAFSHLNPWNFTDVFLAGEKGIGFYPYHRIDDVPIDIILSDIGFKQVISSEAEDPQDPENQTKIAIFAVSNEDRLYFIEGTRNFSMSMPTYKFSASGFPIRADVTHLAARYNASHGTNELLYAAKEEEALFFLRRDPSGRSWVEDKITQRSVNYMKVDAFVTTIVLTNGKGQTVPENHSVQVTADCLHAVANGKAFSFTRQPVEIHADPTGCILIAVPAASKLGCAPFNVKITEAGVDAKSFTITVDPSQRITRMLEKYDTLEKLQQAKSTSGDQPLEGMSNDKLENAADLLRQFGDTRKIIEHQETYTPPLLPPPPPPKKQSWIENAVDFVEAFIGDVIEAAKYVFKTTVKIVIRIVGPVVKVFLKLMGKVLKFVLKGLYGLLEVIGSGLEEYLGYDGLSRFLKLLKLAVDPKSIAATQKYLADVVTGGLRFTDRALLATRDSIFDLMEDGKEAVKTYIDDPRVPVKEFATPGWISKIFNNPLVRLLSKLNPIAWIMEAITEELPDIELPPIEGFIEKLQAVLGDTIAEEANIMGQLWDKLFQQVQIMTSNPQEILQAVMNSAKVLFWTFWDMAQALIEKSFDLLHVFLEEVEPFLTTTWNIPGLTDTWEDISGQKFSILGFMTFKPAVIINLVSLISDGRLPDLKPIKWDLIPVKPFYTSKAKRSQGSDTLMASVALAPPVSRILSTNQDSKASSPEATTSFMALSIHSKVSSNHLVAESVSTLPAAKLANADQVLETSSRVLEQNQQQPSKPVEIYESGYWLLTICEDIGKSMSAFWSMADSVGVAHKKYRTPAVQAPNNFPDRAKRSLAFLMHIGQLLQGTALTQICYANGSKLLNKGTMEFNKKTVANCLSGIFGFCQTSLVLRWSMIYSNDRLNKLGDFLGHSGTIIRVVAVEQVWDLKGSADFTSSFAALLKLVCDALAERGGPQAQLASACGGVVCSVTNEVGSLTGVVAGLVNT